MYGEGGRGQGSYVSMDGGPDDARAGASGAVFAEARPEHIFRAAPMTLVQMYIAHDIARDAVGELGRLGCVQFVDMNADASAFAREFAPQIRRLDDTLRLVRQLEAQTGVTAQLDPDLLGEPLLSSTDVSGICDLLAQDAERLNSLVSSFQRLAAKRDELLEERTILTNSHLFFGKRGSRAAADITDEAALLDSYADEQGFADDDSVGEFDIDDEDPLGPGARGPDTRGFSGVALGGTLKRRRALVLERLCWRATRGNLYFARYPVERTDRDVFLVYTHGAASGERVERIADSLGARTIVVRPGNDARIQVINDQLTEVFSVLDQTEGTLRLEQELVSARLPSFKAVVTKERAIYTALNLFNTDHGRQGLVGEGWVPTDELERARAALAHLSSRTSHLLAVHTIQTSRPPPTHHTTNKVTAAFQTMVDVYGTARHGEVNPGLPTVVTFPFMFAVMFGDLGHGLILFLAALALVLNEAKISRMKNRDELFDMAFVGRYVLLLMGLFSMFTGFVYNDLFSKSMTLFSSAWEWNSGSGPAQRVVRRVYPFGLDWAWHGAENSLRFTNSYKMKLSVLLGFAHMTYSLAFQYVNARHFASWVDIWGNFVPSLVFMQSIFGYLSLTIVYKWCVDWIGQRRDPPGLLDMLIKMFLSPGSVDPPLYKGQAFVQCVLVIVALLCVPWLLLFKPLYLRRQMKQNGGSTYMHLDEHTFAIDEEEGSGLQIQDSAHKHDESFGDIMIHQVIHTIEFCLNCISHTASYLRLWALSLAHNQLSQVLWNMTIQNAFGPTGAKGVFMVVALFGMWFVITVMVLVCMEGTSAMLHALRLHWVEAMSKHFEGEGHPFTPFDLLSLT